MNAGPPVGRAARFDCSPGLAARFATPPLVNVPALVTAHDTGKPDPAVPAQRVAFGTSGHRGSALDTAFNEDHTLAVAQAICLYRALQRIEGPLFLGMDTHALSVPARANASEVMAANGIPLMLAAPEDYTPTPAVSHAILTYNHGRTIGTVRFGWTPRRSGRCRD